MRELNTEEVKTILLNLMQTIHDICAENDIKYTLAYGTLLGAVRHNGFIPWDDDVDLIMPRPDYMRFLEYCNSHKVSFSFVSNELDARYHKAFAKIWDSSTIVEDKFDNTENFNMGVSIDIFPVDGLGTENKKLAWKRLKPFIIKNRILSATNWKKYSKSMTNSWKYEPIRFALFLYTRFINADKYSRKINKKIVKYDYNSSVLVACVGATKTERAIKEKKVFENYVDIVFEGRIFKAISAYNQFLKETYGDYMKLPPKDKQVPHHGRKVFIIE